MLTNLHVKNLVLIDEAEVEFGPGLNILTGETGAGKSILIGSINAALGKKISREMIRTGETSALVELVFDTENPHVLELLKEMDLEAEEGQVIISRKITGSRSVCRINGEACNISQVKALASLLLDIHGQHEHQSLLYPDRQITILDAFAGTEAATAKGEVRALYQEWKNVRKELSAYELDEEARKREAAFLTFEINEIDQAELKAMRKRSRNLCRRYMRSPATVQRTAPGSRSAAQSGSCSRPRCTTMHFPVRRRPFPILTDC